ncbi:MAG: murein biosynthesis integral membrane protein MurJ, partial [Prosthecobacter sp.]|nr:murein biosynthesis integral membrane protein MurJ [Prosthecobacter sp.]
LSMVTAIGMVATPVIILLFAPGFGEGSPRSVLAAEMLRITFPYLLLISVSAMGGAILNTYGYFGVPAITPVLLNISMIAAALYLSPYCEHPIVALAWGVLIAGFAQFLFQLPFLARRGLLVAPQRMRGDPGVKRVMKLMVPALFGVSIAQLNLIVDSVFASFLQVGSVSWLYFTDRLTDFPLGVFGVAISTVILPHLSRQHAEKSLKTFSHAIDWGLQSLLLIGVPAAVGLAVFSMPIIACCFSYGKFNVTDLLQTQKSLIALASGVPAFMMVKVLASSFYARQDIKTPVKVGAFAMLINSLLCAVLIWPLAHAGLALSSSLAGYVNSGVLLYLLLRREIYNPARNWTKFLCQLLVANTVIAVYLYFMAGTAESWLSLSPVSRLFWLFIHISTAAIMYMGILYVLGVRLAQFRGFVKES